VSAWGFTGMFKGAIIMAVLYTLLQSWVDVKNNSGKTELQIDPDAPLVGG